MRNFLFTALFVLIATSSWAQSLVGTNTQTSHTHSSEAATYCWYVYDSPGMYDATTNPGGYQLGTPHSCVTAAPVGGEIKRLVSELGMVHDEEKYLMVTALDGASNESSAGNEIHVKWDDVAPNPVTNTQLELIIQYPIQ